MQKLEWFDQCANKLWQGKGIDLEDTINGVNDFVEELVLNLEELESKGINFPMEYVTGALKHFQEAIEAKDDYLLADCIKYEIKEIAIVYQEIMSE